MFFQINVRLLVPGCVSVCVYVHLIPISRWLQFNRWFHLYICTTNSECTCVGSPRSQNIACKIELARFFVLFCLLYWIEKLYKASNKTTTPPFNSLSLTRFLIGFTFTFVCVPFRCVCVCSRSSACLLQWDTKERNILFFSMLCLCWGRTARKRAKLTTRWLTWLLHRRAWKKNI